MLLQGTGSWSCGEEGPVSGFGHLAPSCPHCHCERHWKQSTLGCVSSNTWPDLRFGVYQGDFDDPGVPNGGLTLSDSRWRWLLKGGDWHLGAKTVVVADAEPPLHSTTDSTPKGKDGAAGPLLSRTCRTSLTPQLQDRKPPERDPVSVVPFEGAFSFGAALPSISTAVTV